MKVDGGCLCGAITYEAVIDPEKIIVCHCTDCQINGGGAFRWGTLIAKDDFTLLSGDLTFYRKLAESGNYRALAFCGDCGTSLYGTQAEGSVTLSLRIGTARQARELTPA
ncbi:MAG: glutathione-dependent formaldehyde-activating protein, partial [Alphaproteobacteria bacterium PA3]